MTRDDDEDIDPEDIDLKSLDDRIPAPEDRTHQEDRFFSKIRVTPEGCWEFTKYTDPDGYGRFWIKDLERAIGAHRAAWIIVMMDDEGPDRLPDCEHLTHDCPRGSNSCCAPDHLEPATAAKNVEDSVTRDDERDLKLSDDDVAEIRRFRVETSMTLREIGDRVGVSMSMAGQVARGDCYEHVDTEWDEDAAEPRDSAGNT